MNLDLEIQVETGSQDVPGEDDIRRWAMAALEGRREQAELLVRVVDSEESRTLNREYRGKDRPTNVLSFPSEVPEIVQSGLLGDLVICAPVVAQEAQDQGKALEAHWAHMVIHGVLHLLGFDHQDDREADEMEALETRLLSGLGFPDPYETEKES